MSLDLGDRRRDYRAGALNESAVAPDPLTQFAAWYAEAEAGGATDSNAATLATVAEGQPTARIVLLKAVEDGAFVFYTNWHSRKARELAANPHATLLFFWRELERQVRVEGEAHRLSAERADAYFATRPRDSQLSAWASAQSEVVASRAALERAYRDVEARFADGPVPRPPHWGGYGLLPAQVEFWQGRAGRLHDRLRYRRAGTAWTLDRLAP